MSAINNPRRRAASRARRRRAPRPIKVRVGLAPDFFDEDEMIAFVEDIKGANPALAMSVMDVVERNIRAGFDQYGNPTVLVDFDAIRQALPDRYAGRIIVSQAMTHPV